MQSLGLFEPSEEVFVHEVDDDACGRGFINMPWAMGVGKTHAIALIRRNTWY